METPSPPPLPSQARTIYSRSEVTKRYQIFENIGFGTYSDVYRARRKSDGLIVALKEVHDYESALREIEALQILRDSPNVVHLHEYFCWKDEDAVLVLEFLVADLEYVIAHAKETGGIAVGEIKRWMHQILEGVAACHRNFIVHRDLKPSNLLVSDGGVLKLADFGQARILQEPRFVSSDNISHEKVPQNQTWMLEQPDAIPKSDVSCLEGSENPSMVIQEPRATNEEDNLLQLWMETTKETNFRDGNTSSLAACTTSDMEDDTLKNSFSYNAVDEGREDGSGALTNCVGTVFYRAPELLYGSTSYGQEIDLWSLGCIFGELLSLEPLFPGSSDIDQLSSIIDVLGNVTEETWPDCSKLPHYEKISFDVIKNPLGLESCLVNRSTDEIHLVQRLVCYNPMNRATAMELLQDKYFIEEPLPVPVNELNVPSTSSYGHDESSLKHRS